MAELQQPSRLNQELRPLTPHRLLRVPPTPASRRKPDPRGNREYPGPCVLDAAPTSCPPLCKSTRPGPRNPKANPPGNPGSPLPWVPRHHHPRTHLHAVGPAPPRHTTPDQPAAQRDPGTEGVLHAHPRAPEQPLPPPPEAHAFYATVVRSLPARRLGVRRAGRGGAGRREV